MHERRREGEKESPHIFFGFEQFKSKLFRKYGGSLFLLLFFSRAFKTLN